MSDTPSRPNAHRRRLRVLLGVLGVLAVAWAIAPALGRLGGRLAGAGTGRQSWMTDEVILEALDGAKVGLFVESEAGETVDVISMRRKEISSLKTRPGDEEESLDVEFDLERDGRRYRVNGRLAWRVFHDDDGVNARFYGFDGLARPNPAASQ